MSGSDAAPVVLRAEDVHVRYRVRARAPREGSRWSMRPVMRDIDAVRGVSLDLRAGESLAIVGQNGSGKSSLLRVLAGLLPPSRGNIHAQVRPRLLGVGAVMRPHWTGRESICVGLAALAVPASLRNAVMADIQDFVELGDALDLPVSTYSRGMHARLLFAISTAVPAGILIVDEALGGADGRFRERAQRRLDRLLEDSGSLIIASHQPALLLRLCTRAVLLRDGRLVGEGAVDDVLAAYGDRLFPSLRNR